MTDYPSPYSRSNPAQIPPSAAYGIYGQLHSGPSATPPPPQPDMSVPIPDPASVQQPLAARLKQRAVSRGARRGRGGEGGGKKRRRTGIIVAVVIGVGIAIAMPAISQFSANGGFSNLGASVGVSGRDYSYYTDKDYGSDAGARWDSPYSSSGKTDYGWYYNGPYQYGPYGTQKQGSAAGPAPSQPQIDPYAEYGIDGVTNDDPVNGGAPLTTDSPGAGTVDSVPLTPTTEDNPYANRLGLLFASPSGQELLDSTPGPGQSAQLAP